MGVSYIIPENVQIGPAIVDFSLELQLVMKSFAESQCASVQFPPVVDPIQQYHRRELDSMHMHIHTKE